MKNSIIIAIFSMATVGIAKAQNVNWRSFEPAQQHIVTLTGGWDYGLTLGIGYGRKFNTKLPALANVEYSFPAGENLFDDFKIRLGGQVEVLRLDGWSFTAKAYAPIRRFENTRTSLFSFGGEFAGLVGYYKEKWYVAGEFGFDKAIATHIRHKGQTLEDYPAAQDGWYVPTGGNFNYGLQAGFSAGANDLSLRMGKLASQGWDTTPFIPLFAQFGYQRRF
jgi:hypothetical protein